MTSILPIVHNLHAEVLLCEANAPTEQMDLEQVWNYACSNACKAEEVGDVRSAAVAWTIGARAKLRLADPRLADYAGKKAVALLEEHGPRLPALRPEEVYHFAARAAAANGRETDAEALDQRARAELDRKFNLLAPEHRDSFRSVSINLAIQAT